MGCLLTVSLEGCFGGVVLGDVSRTIDRPVIERSASLLRPANNGASPVVTLRDLWGEPESIAETPNGHLWNYRMDRWRWHGLVLFVLIPIPLIVPFGYEQVRFHIEDGLVAKCVFLRSTAKYGAYCGLGITAPWVCAMGPEPQ
jgi:hypothetical protein